MQIDRNRNLAGRVALITGGAAGIGLAIAEKYVARGATVVIADRDPAAGEALRDRTGFRFVTMDATSPEDTVAAFDAAEKLAGPVDIAIANAGISQNGMSVDLSFADWRKVMALNLDGVFLTAQEAGRRMIPRGKGVILMLSSIYGVVAAPQRLAYVVSKSGVSAMAKALALEWAPHGIRVNAMAPGYVRTALVDDLVARGRLDPDAILRRTPMGRMISTEEIAELAAFLASDEASAITGQISSADGGWTANGFM